MLNYLFVARKEVYLMFKALNTQKTGKLTLEEFYQIYDVTDLDWKVRPLDNKCFILHIC